MAAASQRNDNSYEDGGGFGKFRKRPFRRVSATPYDRPPTAIRNPNANNNNNNDNNGGWLSKIVDPAQRLITYSAHKLFASVFRKRLPPPPPPPQPPEPEANGVLDKQQDAFLKNPPGIQGSTTNNINHPASSSDRGVLTEVELMLKQKTFTKAEIDRLTALLHSRNIDQPLCNEDKKYEAFSSKGVLLLDRKELPYTPPKDNGHDSHRISTPIVSSSVLDEDVASPAELAKAYMGSRPSKVSPSVLGLRGQPVGESAIVQIDRPFNLRSPIMSVVPKSSRHVVPTENRFATPRPRGRSAIYSMARTPYSRVHSTSTLQGAGTEIDALSAPSSSSQSLWESGRFCGSKQGASKRRSSVLENDIGSVGPIRRIRQKSNLLASSGNLSGCGTGFASDAIEHNSAQKQVLASEPSVENGYNSVHGSGVTSIPSKSSEMASKILQQLDVLVSSRDKSPAKLSPSMLRGPALRSLENADSSKFLKTFQDNNKLDAKHVSLLPDARDSMSQKQDKVEENGLVKFPAFDDKSTSALSGVNSTSLVNNSTSDGKAISFGMNSVAQAPPLKKRAFQMSAHEDYLEFDDDDNSDRAEEKKNLDTNLAENRARSSEAVAVEKPGNSSLAKPHMSSLLSQTPPMASDGFVAAEKRTAIRDQAAPLPGVTVEHAVEDKQPTLGPDKISSPEVSNAAVPLFGFSNNFVSPKEPNGFPTSNFSSKTENAVPQLPFATAMNSTSLKFGNSSEPKSESSSSAIDATKPLTKEHESDKGANKNNIKAGVFFSSAGTVSSAVSMPSSTAGALSFSSPANNLGLNGSLAPIPSFSSSIPSLVSQNMSGPSTSSNSGSIAVNTSNNSTVVATTTANIDISNHSLSTPAPSSFLSAPALKFSSPVVPSTPASSVSATTGVEPVEAKRSETSFGNLPSVSFGIASSPITSTGGSLLGSTGSSIFNGISSAVTSGGTSSAITNKGNGIFNFNAGASTSAATTNQSQGFNPFSAASAQASVAGTVFSTSTQSTPIQFGSTASSPFAFTANTAPSSGSSLFSSSSSTGKLFSSGTTFGLTSTTSEANPVSSTTATTSPAFGFGSAFNSSSSGAGFVFGALSTSNAVSSTTSMTFGSSPSASSGPVFNFSSGASATNLLPAFPNPNPAPAFTTSSPSGNNDQMNMEDSMAEDTVQATSTVPVFGQQPIAAPPSSGYLFGSATPTVPGNQFVPPQTVSAASSPFQFSSQPNLVAPQNQSPFQATGSLEFNAGGSFSLGTADKSNRKFVRVSRKTQRKK